MPYLFYVGLPALLQAPAAGFGHGLGVTATGVALLPGAVLVFLGGRFAPWLIARLSARAVAGIALGAMLAGSLGIAALPGSLGAVVGFFCLIGLGNGIGFAVVAELIAGHAPAAGIGAALGVNGVLRTVGSALGTPLATVLLASAASGSAGGAARAFLALFLVAAAISLLGVGLSRVLPRA